jgi:hypothetical protein
MYIAGLSNSNAHISIHVKLYLPRVRKRKAAPDVHTDGNGYICRT